uniref:Integrase catalytic domain-containing protein n=1 Tax=Ascaris lumbricoides TaxID=6252 RepID=A0A0M3HXD9_ASCLU
RCGGRLSETVIPRSEKYPIFLPQNHRLTQLLILREHTSIFHGGAPATLSRLRQHFWIPHGRRAVRLVITNHCLQCRRWKAKPFALPPMPPLPAARVQPAPAFDCTGIDLLGPIRVSSETGASKRWIALFTCLVTRAVHLEIAEDLSALSLVECLRRFIARRGLPREIISDNGTNMILTAKSLKDIPDACSVKWTFITAFAPWKGGVYERLVGLTKTCLRRSVGRRLLSDGELRTLAAEVEAVLNERPITYVESDDIQVIRPIDYLRPRAHLSVHVERTNEDPEFNPQPPSTRQQLLEQWSKAQECRNKFWEIWSREYLQLLRERDPRFHKGPRLQEHRIPRVGEIVLLSDTTAPRAFWRLAKVVEVPIGSDNRVRTARVKCSSGRTFLRTIAQLYPLEVSSDETEQTEVSPGQTPRLRNSDKNADDPQPALITRRITRSMTRSQQLPTTNAACYRALRLSLQTLSALLNVP